jgi:hypothetical protein
LRLAWSLAVKEDVVGLFGLLGVRAPVVAGAEAVGSAEGASEAGVVGESPAVGDVGDCFLAVRDASEFTRGQSRPRA